MSNDGAEGGESDLPRCGRSLAPGGSEYTAYMCELRSEAEDGIRLDGGLKAGDSACVGSAVLPESMVARKSE